MYTNVIASQWQSGKATLNSQRLRLGFHSPYSHKWRWWNAPQHPDKLRRVFQELPSTWTNFGPSIVLLQEFISTLFIYFQKCWILQNPFKATEITAFWTSILWLKLGDWSSSTQSARRAAHVKLHQFDHACAPLATFGQSDPWPPVTTIFPQDRPPTFRLYPPESKVRPLPTMPTFRLTSPPVQCHARLKVLEKKKKRVDGLKAPAWESANLIANIHSWWTQEKKKKGVKSQTPSHLASKSNEWVELPNWMRDSQPRRSPCPRLRTPSRTWFCKSQVEGLLNRKQCISKSKRKFA